MHPHPYFDLLLHDDAELETLLGAPLRERVTLHEWPLSCVQRVTLADGRRWIYKAQREPSVEAQFLARANSSLLPAARTLWQSETQAALAWVYLDGAPFDPAGHSEADILRLGRELCAQIAALPADLPVYLDVSSLPRWRRVMKAVLANLAGFIRAGLYTRLQLADVVDLERAAFSPALEKLFQQPARLAHGDLSAENIIILPEGPRVIDWQYPRLAPPGLDWVIFLRSAGLDARRHAAPGALLLRDLLAVHWFSECTRRWFPPGAETYDRQIAEIAAEIRSDQARSGAYNIAGKGSHG